VNRRKLKHASGWALLGVWFLFGTSCASSPDRAAAMRSMLDVVRMVCPPEMTVGDCAFRVEKLLDMPREMAEQADRAAQAADAGTD
jgi:hypothetical protein